jgi:hypothetical protein
LTRAALSRKKFKRIPIYELQQEEEEHELAMAADMRPYIQLAKAGLQGADIKTQVEEISKLPLEKRYLWRGASALKWAFASITPPIGVGAWKECFAVGTEDCGVRREWNKRVS